MELSKYQKDELVDWIHSNTGKNSIKASSKAAHNNKRKASGIGKEGDKKPEGGGNWRKKLKQSMKMTNGLNLSMMVLAGEEKTNKALIAAYQSSQTTDDTPALQITVVKDSDPDSAQP